MSMEMRQTQKQVQQMVMTPQLQQAIKLLQMGRQDMVQTVQEELKENPCLEDSSDTETELDRDSAEQRHESSLLGETEQVDERSGQKEAAVGEQEVPDGDRAAKDVDWEPILENAATAHIPSTGRLNDDDMPTVEQTASSGSSLSEHLLREIRLAQFPDDEAVCATLIIHNLDGDGYFKDPPIEQIAEETEVDLVVANRALHRLQRLDPVGCAARTLVERLLIQAEVLAVDDEILVKMLTEHLGDVERHNFARIAQKLKVDLEEVVEAFSEIQRLEPHPARQFLSERTQYITPDVYIRKVGDKYLIQTNDDGMPKLRLSRQAVEILKSQGKDKVAKEYLQERLRQARWLIDSLHQRQRTILRVAESILERQREFFERGINYLKPLILRDIASDIGMHESTISRATSQKYVHTPQGLFELKFFFNASIKGDDGGEDLASEAVKRMIKQLTEAEDHKKPLSDQKLVDLLRIKHKVEIARRTVAKYREQLGILPSAQRKKVF